MDLSLASLDLPERLEMRTAVGFWPRPRLALTLSILLPPNRVPLVPGLPGPGKQAYGLRRRWNTFGAVSRCSRLV